MAPLTSRVSNEPNISTSRFNQSVALLLSLIAAVAACSSGGSGGRDRELRPLASIVSIDGSIDFSLVDRLREATITIADSYGLGSEVHQSKVRYGFSSDDRNLYVAIEWTDPTFDHDFDPVLGPVDFDGVRLVFDNDGDGTAADGEDARVVIAASVGSQYVDQHQSDADETDRIGDGIARLTYDETRLLYQAEFLLPLVSDAYGEDADFSNKTRYNIVLFDHVQPQLDDGNAGGLRGLSRDSGSWSSLRLDNGPPRMHPELPTGLAGRIVFISDHEVPTGEIYSFDLGSSLSTRLTFRPDLFKDAVSLSHDRSRVAFHASPNRDDFDAYEIWVLDIDSGVLRQMTDNQMLDGHPAWSPADDLIAYASFRDAGGASIVVMTAEGVEITDLTPPGLDDNDPEFLLDGRILFKTSRFASHPQTRIAVMDSDGSNVTQLSFIENTSDHDPTSDGNVVVFERFPKPTDYTMDVEAGFVGWDLIEVELATLQERSLVADGWVNWLPIHDPSHAYVLYLRSAGYTEARLLTRDGEDLGRLIPDITRIRYIDWK